MPRLDLEALGELAADDVLVRGEEECDGTVGVSETRLPGATDHIVLPVSHMGLLVSPRVARETGLFLQNGRFSLR